MTRSPEQSERRARLAMQRWAWNARMRLGCWIIGGELFSMWALLWLIRERAMTAIKRDGTVVLADCPALAEALYEQIPDAWTFTMSRVIPSADASPAKAAVLDAESERGIR